MSTLSAPNAPLSATEPLFRLSNPPALGQPLGSYSQILEAPAGSALVFLSGQTPRREDGSIPASFDEQAEQVWQRIGTALRAVGLDCGHICRVVTYLTQAEDAAAHARIRSRHLGDARPAATGLVVAALFHPDYRIEVEITAARPA